MNIRALAVFLLLSSTASGSVEIEVVDQPVGEFKTITVRAMKSEVDAGSSLPILPTSVVISLEEEGKTKMVLPQPLRPLLGAGGSSMIIVSEDMLPKIKIQVSGHIALPNVCGDIHYVYRYNTDKKRFDLVEPKRGEPKATE